jgi:hypothetical protein
MSTLELENIKHPDNSGDNIALASNGSITIDRKSTDGSIIEFRKDGTTVGRIGSYNGVPYIGYQGGTGGGIMFNGTSIEPTGLGSTRNNGINDIGSPNYLWKDAYLSGGIYLGGTGAVNKLDDYEEGTWTASFGGTNASNISNTTGYYTKIGNTVHFTYYSSQVNLANAVTGGARIYGLPFTSSNSAQRYGLFLTSYGNAIQNESNGGFVAKNGTYMLFMIQESNSESTWYDGTNKRIMVAGTYMVD